MSLPISVTYTFATATTSIPLSQLDANFTTVVNAINSLGNGTTSFTAITSSGDGTFSGTGQIKLPAGTTAQRSGSPASGMFRFNTSSSQFEGYNGSAWGSIGGGATGGGSDAIFYLNGQTITTSYSIPSGQNAMSTGSITINSGAVVTIPSGSRWVIL
jgi:hypothetical protein